MMDCIDVYKDDGVPECGTNDDGRKRSNDDQKDDMNDEI